MPAEICLKLPVNFLHREEVRRFVMALERRMKASVQDASFYAVAICLDFAGQGRDWRPLYSAPVDQVDWDTEELGRIIAGSAGWDAPPRDLMEAAIEARYLVLERREGVAGLVCPLFSEWNPHLLPGFQSMQKKGQIASAEARRRRDDPVVARQQREIMQRQEVLDLGELGDDVTTAEIETAIAFVMQIDRAGGMAVRSTKDYATWMLAAGVRILRAQSPKDIEGLLAFLLEARQDPTVPKGAELVLQQAATLLERSAY